MIATAALAAALACYSPTISDGDTFRCAGERVRLYGVDAPEIRHGQKPAQPYAYEAQERLRQLTRGPVTCEPAGNRQDRYGRLVMRCAGLVPDIGAQLVREGLAVELQRFSKGEYEAREDDARARRRGVWSGR